MAKKKINCNYCGKQTDDYIHVGPKLDYCNKKCKAFNVFLKYSTDDNILIDVYKRVYPKYYTEWLELNE